MTDTPAAAIPAGWYADSTSPGLMRWWDGTAWTEHTAAAAASVQNGALVLQRPLLPADRPVYSPFIWLIVLLPLVTLPLLFTWQPNFRYTTGASGTPTIDPLSIYTPGYFVILAVGWIGYGLTVFFAYRDVVWLRKQGVVRPFHWAWTFLSSLVYVIGRSVIAYRVAAPRGRAPIWALIGVLVLSFIVSIAWTVSLTTQLVSQLPPIGR
jgi:hypothetical protein